MTHTKQYIKRMEHLVAADIIVTLVDTAAIWSGPQRLGH